MTIEGLKRIVLLVIAATTLSCRGAARETPDEPGQPLVDRGGGAKVDTGPELTIAEVTEKYRLEQEPARIAYLALPPAVAAGPMGSSTAFPSWRNCPPHYGVAEADADAGDYYCGKICGVGMPPLGKSPTGVSMRCDNDGDASTSCCGRHRCDHRSINQSFVPPDGPMPTVCSPDEKAAKRPAR